MQMNYYENLLIELPDGIQEMTEDEKSYFYPQMSLDFAWIDKNSSNIRGHCYIILWFGNRFSKNDHKNDRACNPVIKSEIVPSLIGEIWGDKRNCFVNNM